MTTTEKTAVVTDPLGDLDYVSRDLKRRHATAWNELYQQNREDKCGATTYDDDLVDDYVGEAGRFSCSRRSHPDDWKHIATYDDSNGGYVIGYWGGAPADPETETDPDPAPFTLTIGTIYKFRNRPTMLMLVGTRPNNKCEVLDLTHKRFRLLDGAQLIPRRDDAAPLEPDQLKWVAQFMAERRNKVREVAIRQRGDGYFKTGDELNQVLTELGLEPHLPTRGGQFQPTLKLRTKGLSDRVALRLLTEWVQSLPPLPAGITYTRTPELRDMFLELREESR